MSLGKRILEIRQSRAFTQADLSSRTGLAVAYLSRIENDHIEPSFTTLNKIADALEVNLTDFFGYQEEKRFQDRCPVSLSGRCIADVVYGTGRKRRKVSVESYSQKQLQLLQLSNYLILFGDKKLHQALELLLLALVRSPSVRKDREWLKSLSIQLRIPTQN